MYHKRRYQQRPGKAPDFLKLKLQRILSCLTCTLGADLGSGTAASALNF